MTLTNTYTGSLNSPSLATSGAVVVAYSNDLKDRAALHYAVQESLLRRSQLQVIHQLTGIDVPDRLGDARDCARKRDQAAARIHRQLVALEPELTDFDVVITTDLVADELTAASRHASLVIMGTSATHGAVAVLLSGLSRQVAHHAHCPVMLVPGSQISLNPRALVCGVDRTPASASALEWATHEAALRGLDVVAVEVGRDADAVISQGNALRQWISGHVPKQSGRVKARERIGAPAKTLLDTAVSRDGILVIGRHDDKHWFNRSVLEAVAAQTDVPVVVVPMTVRSTGVRS